MTKPATTGGSTAGNRLMRLPALEGRRPDDFAVILAVLFVTAFATNISTPFLSLYRNRLALTPTATQAIFVVYVVGIITTLLASGPLSDRIGRRSVAIPALGLSALSSVLLILGRDSYPLLLLGRLLLGGSVGAVFAVATAWIQDVTGPDKALKVAFGTTIVTYGGFGAGPALSAMYELALPRPLVAPFVIHLVMVLIVAVLIWPVPDSVDTASPVRGKRAGTRAPRLPKQARVLFITAVVPAACWVFVFPSSSFALFPVLLADQVPGRSVQVAGAAAVLTAVSGLAAKPILARLAPGPSMVASMVAGTVGLALGAGAFGFDRWPLLLPASVLLGAASGTISAACLAVVAGVDAERARGLLTSALYLVTYPGMAVPLAATAVSTVFDMTTTLIALTSMAAIGTGGVIASVAATTRLSAAGLD